MVSSPFEISATSAPTPVPTPLLAPVPSFPPALAPSAAPTPLPKTSELQAAAALANFPKARCGKVFCAIHHHHHHHPTAISPLSHRQLKATSRLSPAAPPPSDGGANTRKQQGRFLSKQKHSGSWNKRPRACGSAGALNMHITCGVSSWT